MNTKKAFDIIDQSVKSNPDYAYAWYANVLNCVTDIDENSDTAHDIAANFMEKIFEVNYDFSDHFKNKIRN